MAKRYIPFNEYLYYNSSPAAINQVMDIIENYVGKFICPYPSNWNCQLPKYYIIGIDKNKGKLIVHPVTTKLLCTYYDGEYDKWGEFDVKIEKNKVRQISLKIDARQPMWMKAGIYQLGTYNLLDIDVSKPLKKVILYHRDD